jgi:hypothetical protein
MLRIILLFTALAVSAGLLACGPATSNNGNGNTAVVNAVDNAGIPNGNVNANGFAPVSPVTNTTPGIPPANAITPPKGATPTPGIPAPGNVNKPIKPGATPTPGIPDQETIRRQLQGIDSTNMNAPAKGDMMQMRPMKRGKGLNGKPVGNNQ